MSFRRVFPRLFSVIALLAAALVPLTSATAATASESPPTVSRISGTDVIDVAAEAVSTQYPAGQSVTFVVGATAYADGMVAAARAAGVKAPVVLVDVDSVPGTARSALEHLDSDRIIIVGGPAVVSTGVEAALASYARSGVERVSGANRYQTAAELASKFDAGVRRLYIAGGAGYADAFTGGGLAGLQQAPMLLVQSDTLVAPTVAQLERLRPEEIVVLGGPARVSDAVIRQLGAYAGTGQVSRLAGANRYASAAKIAERLPASEGMYVVNGTDYALGAVAGALTGLTGHPLLLTRSTSVPAVTATAITDSKPAKAYAVGTSRAISDVVVHELDGLLSLSETGRCEAPAPAGTVFGANAWNKDKTLEQAVDEIDEIFGDVPVVRHFSSGLPFAWDSRQANLLRDRTLVVSFKTHPRDINSGSLDGFFRTWFETAPDDQTIYWSYFHEPENNISAGEFTATEYRKAWARLARLADSACKPNMFSTLILTEWTMNPQANRDYRVYDAGHDAVDVVAFDPYNGVWDPERDYYVTPRELLGHIVQAMEKDGRPWGIAEIGSRIAVGDDGRGRAAWLRSIGDYARDHDALFVTYFHAIGNGDWRLNDNRSRAAWTEVVDSSSR